MPTQRSRSASVRKVPRQSRSRYVVDLILDTTSQILLQEGYSKVTTNRIAEVAGISIGSLYQYFPNKGAIVKALALRHSQKMSEVLRVRFAAIGDVPVAQAAHEIILAEFSAHAVEENLHRALLQEVPKHARVTATNDVPTDADIANIVPSQPRSACTPSRNLTERCLVDFVARR